MYLPRLKTRIVQFAIHVSATKRSNFRQSARNADKRKHADCARLIIYAAVALSTRGRRGLAVTATIAGNSGSAKRVLSEKIAGPEGVSREKRSATGHVNGSRSQEPPQESLT